MLCELYLSKAVKKKFYPLNTGEETVVAVPCGGWQEAGFHPGFPGFFSWLQSYSISGHLLSCELEAALKTTDYFQVL